MGELQTLEIGFQKPKLVLRGSLLLSKWPKMGHQSWAHIATATNGSLLTSTHSALAGTWSHGCTSLQRRLGNVLSWAACYWRKKERWDNKEQPPVSVICKRLSYKDQRNFYHFYPLSQRNLSFDMRKKPSGRIYVIITSQSYLLKSTQSVRSGFGNLSF